MSIEAAQAALFKEAARIKAELGRDKVNDIFMFHMTFDETYDYYLNLCCVEVVSRHCTNFENVEHFKNHMRFLDAAIRETGENNEEEYTLRLSVVIYMYLAITDNLDNLWAAEEFFKKFGQSDLILTDEHLNNMVKYTPLVNGVNYETLRKKDPAVLEIMRYNYELLAPFSKRYKDKLKIIKDIEKSLLKEERKWKKAYEKWLKKHTGVKKLG